jgi:hypothetical protein
MVFDERRWQQESSGRSPSYPRAVKVSTATASAADSVAVIATPSSNQAFKDLVYPRRYLDWNRLTFAYHAEDSQSKTSDTEKGLKVLLTITSLRKQLNTTALFGCAPATLLPILLAL